MAAKGNLEVLQGDGEKPEVPGRLDLAIDVLRARVDEEFSITERLDAKGRQVFGLCAAFFAVAQAVAFSAFRAADVTTGDRWLIAGCATVAALGLLITGHRLVNGEEPRTEIDLEPSQIEEWARDKSDEEFAQLLVVHLRRVADARHDSNETRAANYMQIEFAGRWSLILTTLEIIVAVACRI